MATYMVILEDDEGNQNWTYPTEIEATDKNDALKAIAENVPVETIKHVLTKQEYTNLIKNKNFIKNQQLQNRAKLNATNFSNSTDFFNNITNTAMAMAEEQEKTSENMIDQNIVSQKETINTQSQTEVKYFEDNGSFFKLENNILYKKCWETISGDDLKNYRIINNESNKIINKPNYSIQVLTWKQL